MHYSDDHMPPNNRKKYIFTKYALDLEAGNWQGKEYKNKKKKKKLLISKES